jgi:hypothetical protein
MVLIKRALPIGRFTALRPPGQKVAAMRCGPSCITLGWTDGRCRVLQRRRRYSWSTIPALWRYCKKWMCRARYKRDDAREGWQKFIGISIHPPRGKGWFEGWIGDERRTIDILPRCYNYLDSITEWKSTLAWICLEDSLLFNYLIK